MGLGLGVGENEEFLTGICMEGEKHWRWPLTLSLVGEGYGEDTKGESPVGNVTWIGSVQAEDGLLRDCWSVDGGTLQSFLESLSLSDKSSHDWDICIVDWNSFSLAASLPATSRVSSCFSWLILDGTQGLPGVGECNGLKLALNRLVLGSNEEQSTNVGEVLFLK